MSTVDRILEILDVGLQHSTEAGYPTPPAPGDIDYPAPGSPDDPHLAAIRRLVPEPAPRPSRIARVWRDRIDSGRFTKGECQQWTNAGARLARGYSARGYRSNLTEPEAVDLAVYLRARGGVLLTSEHEAQGLAWLERHGPKVLGWSAELADEILAGFRYFTYRGDIHCPDPRGSALPIWRVHLSDGRQLDYFNAAWQSQPWNGPTIDPAWWWVDQYPRTVDGVTVWACCESSIGPVCQHRPQPEEL